MNAIIALNPQQMAEAQTTTQSWIDKKLAAAEAELDEADALHAQLVSRAMRPDHAKRVMDKAAKRVRFYEKCKAALAAGYYIIPPFDIQLFAIRSTSLGPKTYRNESRSQMEFLPGAGGLPVGMGRYVNPQPPRRAVDVETKPDPYSSTPGKTREVTIYENGDWRDEIDLPVRAMKPTIIEAVGKALHEKIFDALGIAPAYRAADPIIAGQIKRPDGKGVLTFFVAWWLDESDL